MAKAPFLRNDPVRVFALFPLPMRSVFAPNIIFPGSRVIYQRTIIVTWAGHCGYNDDISKVGEISTQN